MSTRQRQTLKPSDHTGRVELSAQCVLAPAILLDVLIKLLCFCTILLYMHVISSRRVMPLHELSCGHVSAHAVLGVLLQCTAIRVVLLHALVCFAIRGAASHKRSCTEKVTRQGMTLPPPLQAAARHLGISKVRFGRRDLTLLLNRTTVALYPLPNTLRKLVTPVGRWQPMLPMRPRQMHQMALHVTTQRRGTGTLVFFCFPLPCASLGARRHAVEVLRATVDPHHGLAQS